MAGAMSMVIMVDTHTSDGLYNPRLMQAMDQLQNRIETRYSDQVTRTNSLANIVKDTYQIMSDDPPIIGCQMMLRDFGFLSVQQRQPRRPSSTGMTTTAAPIFH